MPETVDFTPPVRRVPQSGNFVKSALLPGILVLAVILTGAATGWFLSKGGAGSSVVLPLGGKVAVAPGADVGSGGKEVGLDDSKTFRDKAEGILKDGGIDSEGTHHLERAGGSSQNVYLTSSVVDLDQFIDKKVEVWGETIGAKKAGWLMDVGKIKILE